MDVSRSSRIALFTGILQLCACAAPSPGAGRSGRAQPEADHNRHVPRTMAAPMCFHRTQRIVLDLVSSLAQLPTLMPANTTLNASRPHSRFDAVLLDGVRQAGFGVREQQPAKSEGEGDGIRLGYSIHTDAPVDFGDSTLQGVYFFTLNVGDVALRRAYQVSASGVQPASSLFVRGADASGVLLDDTLFSSDQPCLSADWLPTGQAGRPTF